MTSLHPTARRALRSTVLACALGCAAFLATGCAKSTAPATQASSAPAGSAAPASSAAAPGAATATAASAGSGSGTGGSSAAGGAAAGPGSAAAAEGGSQAGGPAPCPTRYLHVHTGVSQGTAGSVYTVLDFTNISATTCTLYGFPGVSQAGGMPVSQIGPAAAESTATPRRLVTLAPGATANALLQIADAGNYPAAQCHPVSASYLQIYPPGQTTPMFLGYSSTACSGTQRILTIGAMRPGAGSAS